MRTHGKQKRRTWRKLHIAINPDGMEIVAIELTEANIHDDSVVPNLLKNQAITGKVYADGAYVSKANDESNLDAKILSRQITPRAHAPFSLGELRNNAIFF